MALTDEVIEFLKTEARKSHWFSDDDDDEGGNADADSDACVEDYAGGNVDDAYDGGVRTGNVEMAQRVLTMLGITWAE